MQVLGNDFYRKQGEVRFARTLDLPANRGRIFDRNGLLLATSVPVPSIWAIPEDVEQDKAKLAQLAKLLQMPLAELMKRLEDPDKNFVWLKRQVDEATARQVAALDLKGVYERRNTAASTPKARRRRTWWASPTWRTTARKAWSWPSTRTWLAARARAA